MPQHEGHLDLRPQCHCDYFSLTTLTRSSYILRTYIDLPIPYGFPWFWYRELQFSLAHPVDSRATKGDCLHPAVGQMHDVAAVGAYSLVARLSDLPQDSDIPSPGQMGNEQK